MHRTWIGVEDVVMRKEKRRMTWRFGPEHLGG